jgi:dolichol-phosphate mannosyltransferase
VDNEETYAVPPGQSIFDPEGSDVYFPRMPRADSAHPEVSVVVPLYNEAANVGPLCAALERELEQLGTSWEVVLVDDGSRDGTWKAIGDAAARRPEFRGLSFSRNFGHQKALLAGLQCARGSAVVTMDGDLQHPPNVIGLLVAAWRQGHRIVYTRRVETDRTGLFKRWTSKVFYRLFSALSGIAMAPGSSDFRLVDRSVLTSLGSVRDAGSFLRGLTQWTGYASTTVGFTVQERHAEKSKYSFGRMLKFAGSATLSFSTIPLNIGIWIGLVTSLLAFAEIVYVVTCYFAGRTVPGWASLAGIISFMFGVLFILIGILGAYLGRIFEILQNRPPYLIERTVGMNEE